MVLTFNSKTHLTMSSLKHLCKILMESAISQVADYYTSRYDLISIPGVTNSAINSLLVRQTEERGDALAIIDMKEFVLQ